MGQLVPIQTAREEVLLEHVHRAAGLQTRWNLPAEAVHLQRRAVSAEKLTEKGRQLPAQSVVRQVQTAPGPGLHAELQIAT